MVLPTMKLNVNIIRGLGEKKERDTPTQVLRIDKTIGEHGILMNRTRICFAFNTTEVILTNLGLWKTQNRSSLPPRVESL